MSLDEQDIRVLSKVGLTPTQARVYLTLLKIGRANGRTISKQSRVARQEVYNILTVLLEIGLVEKMISSPAEFRAVPIQAGLSILMVNRARENKETEEKTKELLKKFASLQKDELTQDKDEFLLIPGRTMFFEKRKRALENISQSLSIITTEKRFAQAMQHLSESYQKALKRGVKIRVIAEKSADEEPFLKTVKEFIVNPNFSLKYSDKALKANIVIFDDSEAIVLVYPTLDLAESPALWTNHSGLIAMYQDHFETVWNSAQEYQYQK